MSLIDPDIDRLSVNLISVDQWDLPAAAGACVAAGVRWIAPWRHQLQKLGAVGSGRLIDDLGLRVSSLCRGGFFTAAASDDNKRAVEEAATLGTDVLVLVCGPPHGMDLAGSRASIARGIEALVPYADDHGVKLGIEPLHPMLIEERSAVVTLSEALDLAERFDPGSVGVVVDVYHVFWDPQVERQVQRAAGRILGFHVSDWRTPRTDILRSRRLMGEGIIDIRGLRRRADQAGYAGPIEVEVMNESLQAGSGEAALSAIVESYRKHVAGDALKAEPRL